MEKFKSIRSVDLTDKRVLLRVDFNVPLDENGKITDGTRIEAALPTIKYILEHEGKLILCSHLGRPKGKRNSKYSLKPVAADLAAKIGRPVIFLDDCIGAEVEEAAKNMKSGSVILLENLRFHAEEEGNENTFNEALAAIGEIYVNDAFGASHREHASISGAPKYMPIKVAGFLMEKELTYLGEQTKTPKKPYVIILGGAKVSGKINVINSLIERADTILIGGAMAYTFYLAEGRKTGKSPVEPDKIEVARSSMEKAEKFGVKLILPVDNLITDTLDFDNGTVGTIKAVTGDIPDGWEGVDIGAKSIQLFQSEIAKANSILWNGPMGIFEIDSCNRGTFAMAQAVSENNRANSIVGGGDSVTAMRKSGYADQVSFISTGGGASLEFLEGKILPGVSILDKK